MPWSQIRQNRYGTCLIVWRPRFDRIRCYSCGASLGSQFCLRGCSRRFGGGVQLLLKLRSWFRLETLGITLFSRLNLCNKGRTKTNCSFHWSQRYCFQVLCFIVSQKPRSQLLCKYSCVHYFYECILTKVHVNFMMSCYFWPLCFWLNLLCPIINFKFLWVV